MEYHYVCERACQIKRKGKIVTIFPGEIITSTKSKIKNQNFRRVTEKVDFENASEEELEVAEFPDRALKEFIYERFGRKTGNRGRKAMIDMLLDCRYREVSDAEFKQTEDNYIKNLGDGEA